MSFAAWTASSERGSPLCSRCLCGETILVTVSADRWVCKVSHSGGRPILFLPDRKRTPGLPEGTTEVTIDGEPYEADFVKVAVNVVRRKGSPQNELAEILRRWFGPSAGLPGTDFEVAIRRDGESISLAPSGTTEAGETRDA